jgi:outer membrane protein assembly factor BamB
VGLPLFCLFGWICLILGIGCSPPVESTPEAIPLPLLELDPAEDGVEVNRWPGWRGRNGSGIASGGSPAIRFSPTEGFRWKAPVPGKGYSSPVVWDDCVLLTTALDDADPPTLAILALDRSDGHLRWRAELGQAEGRTHSKNGYASATVATDGERIVAFFGTTGLFCYDFSGDPLWKADLGDLDHMWGTAASPVLWGDLVFQLCDSQTDSYLAAFDKRTGNEVWRTPRQSSGCWTTPVVIDPDADPAPRPELVVNGTCRNDADERLVIAYDPHDGRQLWRVRGTELYVAPTALFSGGLVYCASGRNGSIFAIRPGGSGDVTESHVVWRTSRGGPYIPSGVAYRNRLYLVSDNGAVACYNAGDGERIWRKRLKGPVTASLVAADGRIYATNERGTVFVFTAADAFELLSENPLDERCLATPAIAAGELFIRTQNHLYCIPGREPPPPSP